MLKFLIADDHAMLREGLKRLLADEFEQAAIHEAGTGEEALAAVRKQNWDVVVLDINLPDKNGMDVLKEIKALRPNLSVLALSLHPEEHYAVRMLKAGASGYLTKETTSHQLADAIRKILKGGTYVSPTLAEQLAGALSGGPAAAPHQSLSDREYEVLCLLAQGRTATEIGDKLSLSVKTISTYRTRLLEKLHLHTTADLIRYAVDRKLVE